MDSQTRTTTSPSVRTPTTARTLLPPTLTALRRRTRLGSLAALALAGPLVLASCAEEPDASPDETTDQQTEEDADSGADEQDDEDGTPEDETPDEEPDEDSADEDSADEGISRDDLPDPEEQLDVERTEELGAFFSEEEACMTVGSTVDGLAADMDSGLETEADLDGAYEAVEQTYLLVPEDLRGPLENIAELLEADLENLDSGAVMTELEPLEEWMIQTCDGQYHQQDHHDDETEDDGA